MGVKAKKYLGQHFLLDKSVGKKIAQALNFNSSLNLLEIGPGTGALTEFINLDNIHLVASELSILKLVSFISFLKRTSSKTKNSGSGPKYDLSPIPDFFRYSSAFFAVPLGSLP